MHYPVMTKRRRAIAFNRTARRLPSQDSPYTYPQPTLSKSASTPGSIFSRHGGRPLLVSDRPSYETERDCAALRQDGSFSAALPGNLLP
jgi:hypothetical protein